MTVFHDAPREKAEAMREKGVFVVAAIAHVPRRPAGRCAPRCAPHRPLLRGRSRRRAPGRGPRRRPGHTHLSPRRIRCVSQSSPPAGEPCFSTVGPKVELR